MKRARTFLCRWLYILFVFFENCRNCDGQGKEKERERVDYIEYILKGCHLVDFVFPMSLF